MDNIDKIRHLFYRKTFCQQCEYDYCDEYCFSCDLNESKEYFSCGCCGYIKEGELSCPYFKQK